MTQRARLRQIKALFNFAIAVFRAWDIGTFKDLDPNLRRVKLQKRTWEKSEGGNLILMD